MRDAPRPRPLRIACHAGRTAHMMLASLGFAVSTVVPARADPAPGSTAPVTPAPITPAPTAPGPTAPGPTAPGPTDTAPTPPAQAAPVPAADQSARQTSPATAPAKLAPIASVFGQTAWQPPAPPVPNPAIVGGGVPVAAPSSAAEASLRVSTVRLASLIDHAVQAANHAEIGHVVDVLVDDKGDAAALVIEIAGFMGVGNRHVALATGLVVIPPDMKQALQTSLSQAQLRSAPTYDAKPGVMTVVSGTDDEQHKGDDAHKAPTGPVDTPPAAPSPTPPGPPSPPALHGAGNGGDNGGGAAQGTRGDAD